MKVPIYVGLRILSKWKAGHVCVITALDGPGRFTYAPLDGMAFRPRSSEYGSLTAYCTLVGDLLTWNSMVFGDTQDRR